MNNNEEQKRGYQQNTSADGRDDFDRQIKNMLEDASLTPPPDFFERIESALEKEKEFKGAKSANNIKAGLKQDNKGIIIPIKGFRRKWSYAASIGVLILLSLGFWKLNLFTGKDQPITSVLNPNTLLSHGDWQKEQQEVAKVTADSSVGNHGSDKAETVENETAFVRSGNQNDHPEAVDPVKKAESDRKSVSNSGNQHVKKEGTNADEITKKPDARIKVNSDEKKETGLVTGHVAANSQVALNEHKPTIVKNQLPGQEAATAVDQEKDKAAQTIAKNDQSVTRQVKDPAADLEPGLIAESTPKEAAIDIKTPRTLVARADKTEEVQSENGRREKRGLFRGLVNHFKERVDEISNEMVDEDNNKTRIKVGCIAITTFK